MKKIIFILFIFLGSINYAQELNCKVSINFEGLPIINREYLLNFAQSIEDYMNKTKFTTGIWEGDKIDCNMNINFSSASDNNYSAQVFVASRRPIYKTDAFTPMLSIFDGNWTFSYEKGQALMANQTVFDPLTGFLDFYAFLIIGYDMDSYEVLGGTTFYQKAAYIANTASSQNANWTIESNTYTRRGIIEDLLNEKYRRFREAFFNYHYNGLDILKQDPKTAIKNITSVIYVLEDMRNKGSLTGILPRVFFDAKNGEIVERVAVLEDPEIYNKLKKIDPPHISKYDEASR